jgi:hypothetical protein
MPSSGSAVAERLTTLERLVKMLTVFVRCWAPIWGAVDTRELHNYRGYGKVPPHQNSWENSGSESLESV